MNITVVRRDLLRLATRASAIAEKKSTIPALSLALLEAKDGRLTCSATDLYSALVDSVPATVAKPGSFAISPRDLAERLKCLPDGPVSLTVKDSTLTLKGEGIARRYTMRGMDGGDYPPIPKPDPNAPTFSLEPGVIGSLIAHTHFAISPDQTRAHMNSAFIEMEPGVVRMVSTDGHRLAKCERSIEGAAQASMLVPLKAVNELKRLDDDAYAASGEARQPIVLIQSGPTLFVRSGTATFSVKLTDAQFPPWRQVIPQSSPKRLRISRAVLADTLKAVSVAAGSKDNGVKISVGKQTMRLESADADRGEGVDEVPCDYEGSNFAIKFSAKYLLDAIGALSCDEIEFGLNGELDPIVVTPVGQTPADFLGVVMPMRL